VSSHQRAEAADVVELAEQAAQAIRALNHLTRNPSVLTDPTDTYLMIGALAIMARRLPQLLGQLTDRLAATLQAGRLRVDASTTNTPTDIVTLLAADLTQAGHYAHRLGQALDTAHKNLSHIIVTDHDDETPEITEPGVNFRPLPGGQFSAAVDT
jgi:hypothetical protein